jgi:predicted DNA-binding protein with PD1-like motif
MIRFDDGDDVLEGLKNLVIKEQIQNSWFQILGGIKHTRAVTGPEKPVMPPTPVWCEVDGAREALGTGSIYFDGDEPRIHLHAALGHHGETMTACIREHTKVYLVLEIMLLELKGFNASRPWFDKGGFNQLTFS